MPNAGPLTADDLLALWKSSTDPSYHLPLLQAGDGQGLETITQLCEVFARLSQAIDRTTQELFILPFSGQTSEPASGPRLSTVTLRITRASAFLHSLTFVPGTNAIEEETTDAFPDGPVVVLTGRRYVLVEYASLPPGATEVEVLAVAERPGRGYDNPLPGTIKRFVQPASGYENTGAVLTPGPDVHLLEVGSTPEVLVPEHVGRYLTFITGANIGQVRRIVSIAQTGLDITAGLAPTGVYSLSLLAGDFIPGENVEQWPSGAKGVALYADSTSMTMSIDRTNAINIAVGQVVVGLTSGAQAVIDSESVSPDMAAETSAHWRVLDWESDLGLSATNDESPTGGRIGMLDALGKERKVARVRGEDDVSYARRVATPADVVSPAAILRAANRVLAPYGFRACLREVGTSKFIGLFYDGDPTSTDPAIAFAYDLDFVVRPDDRFKLALDLIEFRGFFLIGVPASDFGEFGIAYDVGPWNAYDAAPYLAFFDGYPLSAASITLDVWQAVDRVRAAGVGFDLYVERNNCTP